MSRPLAVSLVLVASCAAPLPATRPSSDVITAPAPQPPTFARTPPPASLPAEPWSEPEAQERTLANGLRIVVIEHHSRPLVSVRLFLRTGAASEPPLRAGVTLLSLASLEDRVERRLADGELLESDEKSVRRQVAEQGGSLGYGVSSDHAWLSLDGYAVDAVSYVSTLRATIRARRHGSDGFVARRDSLLDALEEQQLADDKTLGEEVAALAFGDGNPYAQRVGGTTRSLTAIGDEDVVARQNELLQPRGATLLIAGDVRGQAVLAKAEAIFGDWANSAPFTPPINVKVAVPRRSSVHVITRLPARTTGLCAARALSDVTASDAAAQVFAHLVAQQLNEVLRERHGYTYGVQAAVVRRRKARALVLCTKLAASTSADAVTRLVETLKVMRDTPPTAEQVARASASLSTEAAMRHASLAGVVSTWAQAIEVGRSARLLDEEHELAAVTPQQVAQLASRALALETVQFLLSGDPAVIRVASKAAGLGPITLVSVKQ